MLEFPTRLVSVLASLASCCFLRRPARSLWPNRLGLAESTALGSFCRAFATVSPLRHLSRITTWICSSAFITSTAMLHAPQTLPFPPPFPSFVRIPWRLAWIGVWHGLTQAWLVPKQGPTMPGSVSLPKDLTRRRRRRRLRIVAVIESSGPDQYLVRGRKREPASVWS